MIDATDMERLKEVFVTRRECDDITDDLRKTLSDDRVALTRVETKLAIVLWALAAVAGGIITMIIKMFSGVA